MTIALRIDHDYKCLKTHFEHLFTLKTELENQETNFQPVGYDGDAQEYPGTQFHASHLIKPDMVLSTYGFFEFWMQALCEIQRNSQNLRLSFRDIKARNDLDTYHKYLTQVAVLNLGEIPSRLHELRSVRNKLIHSGGHISDSEHDKFRQIHGIFMAGSLLVISSEFIWDLLDRAKEYISYVANTQRVLDDITN